jgi:hypothetical protein
MYKSVIAAAIAASFCVFAVSSVHADDHHDHDHDHDKGQRHRKYNRDEIGRFQEEIRLQAERAKELEAVIARDTQTRDELHKEAGALERHAKGLRARAGEFRKLAEDVGDRAEKELVGIAKELETFAARDEENARNHHDLASRLDALVKQEQAAHDWHVDVAKRLHDHAASNT